MPRAMWSGSISFGLVNIPVRLAPATIDRRLDFDFLTKKGDRVGYERVNKSTGEKVAYEDIVKGYQLEKGDYVMLTDEDFEKADVKKTSTIQIVDFVEESEIPSEYFEKPYFLEPQKNAEKAYVLLREALEKTGKVGIARFVLRTTEHLAVLKPHGKAIILNQIRFQEEIKSIKKQDFPDADVSTTELAMAKKLIEELTTKFVPEKYQDTFTEKIKDTIEKKAKGKTVKVDEEEAPKATEVSDLMEQLKKSLKSSSTAN